jgi:EPS-associated MarR family transcriptional regulator
MTNDQNITEDQLDLLHLIEKDGKASQRRIAQHSGFSIGKVNYCLKALVEVGYIKLQNYNKSDNKIAYAYILTPKGIKQKVLITNKFIARKQREYDKLVSYISR